MLFMTAVTLLYVIFRHTSYTHTQYTRNCNHAYNLFYFAYLFNKRSKDRFLGIKKISSVIFSQLVYLTNTKSSNLANYYLRRLLFLITTQIAIKFYRMQIFEHSSLNITSLVNLYIGSLNKYAVHKYRSNHRHENNIEIGLHSHANHRFRIRAVVVIYLLSTD